MDDSEARALQAARAFCLISRVGDFLDFLALRIPPLVREQRILKAEVQEWIKEERRLNALP